MPGAGVEVRPRTAPGHVTAITVDPLFPRLGAVAVIVAEVQQVVPAVNVVGVVPLEPVTPVVGSREPQPLMVQLTVTPETGGGVETVTAVDDGTAAHELATPLPVERDVLRPLGDQRDHISAGDARVRMPSDKLLVTRPMIAECEEPSSQIAGFLIRRSSGEMLLVHAAAN
jgi:hypothetical protein